MQKHTQYPVRLLLREKTVNRSFATIVTRKFPRRLPTRSASFAMVGIPTFSGLALVVVLLAVTLEVNLLGMNYRPNPSIRKCIETTCLPDLTVPFQLH